jgi:hypothetical protein
MRSATGVLSGAMTVINLTAATPPATRGSPGPSSASTIGVGLAAYVWTNSLHITCEYLEEVRFSPVHRKCETVGGCLRLTTASRILLSARAWSRGAEQPILVDSPPIASADLSVRQ